MSQATVTVRKTNTFQALLDRLRGVRFGCYIVWIHNYEVTRVAEVAQPEKIETLVESEEADSLPKPIPRTRKNGKKP